MAATFEYFRNIVHRRAAIVLENGKEYLVETRLGPVAKSIGLASVDELVGKVRSDERSKLATQVIEALTTNETSFFRDHHPFEALKTKILPALATARASTGRLRIWCAAASTGQEPYSIAMTALTHPATRNLKIEIQATDINTTVLARARAGVFKQLEVNRGLPAPMLAAWFDRRGMDWEIKPAVRSLVTFSELNLCDSFAQLGQCDLVFMRNVLIYFDLETKRQILTRVRRLMAPDAWLVLGGAETTLNLDDQFVPIRVGPAVIYQSKA
ncbi:MAG: protein-glutamate O-methyltransferase CheR [Archangium sp.]